LGPKATQQGKDLLTPSLLRMAWIAHRWILFKMATSIVVMIAALRLGMPRPAARMHLSVLLHMKYFIKMAHGISDSFYCVL
jgi:hypothetical protein